MRRRSGWSLLGSGERAGAHERPHGELGQPDSDGPSHFPTSCGQNRETRNWRRAGAPPRARRDPLTFSRGHQAHDVVTGRVWGQQPELGSGESEPRLLCAGGAASAPALDPTSPPATIASPANGRPGTGPSRRKLLRHGAGLMRVARGAGWPVLGRQLEATVRSFQRCPSDAAPPTGGEGTSR
jgi:hypothetical protein